MKYLFIFTMLLFSLNAQENEHKKDIYVKLNDFKKIDNDLLDQGPGSGLNADKFDNIESKKFARIDLTVTFSSDVVFSASTVTFNQTAIFNALQTLFNPGNVNNPSIAFSSDSNTGFYWIADSTFGMVSNGILKISFGISSTSYNDGSLTIDYTNNRIGVGTTTPVSALSIVGEARITGIGNDGNGTIVCIKSNGDLGTCTVSITGVTCTCA